MEKEAHKKERQWLSGILRRDECCRKDRGKAGAPGGLGSVCSGIFSRVGVAEKVTFEQRLETESSESHGSGVWGRPVRGAGVKARGREGLNGQEPE